MHKKVYTLVEDLLMADQSVFAIHITRASLHETKSHGKNRNLIENVL